MCGYNVLLLGNIDFSRFGNVQYNLLGKGMEAMQLVNLLVLQELKFAHADARGALDAWRAEVERTHWSSPQDVKDRYSTASFLGNNRIIFNIKGNSYRLVVKVLFRNGIVLIEWGGTHAEYDKMNFSR
jgi:mRNA interferase HigB